MNKLTAVVTTLLISSARVSIAGESEHLEVAPVSHVVTSKGYSGQYTTGKLNNLVNEVSSSINPDIVFVFGDSKETVSYTDTITSKAKVSKTRGLSAIIDDTKHILVSSARTYLSKRDPLKNLENSVKSRTVLNIVRPKFISYIQPLISSANTNIKTYDYNVQNIRQDKVTSKAYADLKQDVYISQSLYAYFKYTQTTEDYFVYGYYNGYMIFGSTFNIHLFYNITVKSNASTTLSYIQSIGKVEQTITSKGKTKVYVKDNKPSFTIPLISSATTIKPSNISPYRDAEGYVSADSASYIKCRVYDYKTDDRTDIITSSTKVSVEKNTLTEDDLELVSKTKHKVYYKYGIDKDKVIGELISSALILTHFQSPAKGENTINSFSDIRLGKGENLQTNNYTDVLTSSATQKLSRGVVSEQRIVSVQSNAKQKTTVIEKETPKETHSDAVISSSATDIREGNNIFFERTETVESNSQLKMVYNPAIYRVENETTSNAHIKLVFGDNKAIEEEHSDTIISSAKLSTVLSKITEKQEILLISKVREISLYHKHFIIPTENIEVETLISSSSVKLSAARIIEQLISLSSNSNITIPFPNDFKMEQKSTDSVSSKNYLYIVYISPKYTEYQDTLESSAIVNFSYIGEYTATEEVMSEGSIKTKVIEKESEGTNTVISSLVFSISKDTPSKGTVGILNTGSAISIEPSVLVDHKQTLIESVLYYKLYVKDSTAKNIENILSSSLGNIKTGVGNVFETNVTEDQVTSAIKYLLSLGLLAKGTNEVYSGAYTKPQESKNALTNEYITDIVSRGYTQTIKNDLILKETIVQSVINIKTHALHKDVEHITTVFSNAHTDIRESNNILFERTETVESNTEHKLIYNPGIHEVESTIISVGVQRSVFGKMVTTSNLNNNVQSDVYYKLSKNDFIFATIETLLSSASIQFTVHYHRDITNKINTLQSNFGLYEPYSKHINLQTLINTNLSKGYFANDYANKVTITLNKQGGSGGTNSIESIKGYYITPTSITPPTKDGYTFEGYRVNVLSGTQRINKSGVFVDLTDSTYSSNATLHAYWDLITYTLTHNRNGGVGGNNSATYDIEQDVTLQTLLGVVTKAGHTFTGWKWLNNTAGGWIKNNIYPAGTSVLNKYASGTLEAQWNINTYTIKWYSHGGVVLKTDPVTYGGTSTAPTGTTNTMQYTYTWPKQSVVVTDHENITELRTVNKYTINWLNYVNTNVKSETLNYNSVSTAPANTAATAQYTYTWPKQSTTVKNHETIKEIRTTNKYTIEFVSYDGVTVSTQVITYGDTPTKPNNTSNTMQYTYAWPNLSAVTGPATYHESRTVNKYKIQWFNYLGTLLKEETLNYGSVSAAPIGTMNTPGYTFTWPKQNVTVTNTENVTERRTANTFKLTFNSNSGMVPNPATKTVTYNEPYGALATTSKTYHEFLGWYKSSADSNLVYNGYQQLENNENFNGTGYDPVEKAFYHTSSQGTIMMTDYIEVQGNGLDQFDQYTIQAEHKQPTVNVAYSRYYFMIICYDKFKQQISINQVYSRANTETVLTANLVAGQEWVYVNDIANWYDDGAVNNVHQKSLALWHPDDPTDPYTPYKYTRRILAVKFVDKENKRLQLNTAYNGVTIPAGSPAQNHLSGSTYSYIGASNVLMTADWITRTGTSSAKASVDSMRYGSKYFRVAWLINRNAGTETSYIRNVSVKNITSSRQQSLITPETIMDLTKDHTVSAHWNPAIVNNIDTQTLISSSSSDLRFEEERIISRTETLSSKGYFNYENQTVFKITLDKNSGTGGTTTITGSTNINITPTSVTPPTKVNYTFIGYYTQTSGGTKYINADGSFNNLNSTTFIGDVKLYAQWSMDNIYFDWNPLPNSIGFKADIYINDTLQQAAASDWYQQRIANSSMTVKNLNIPSGWQYASYTTSNLTSVTVGGSGATTEVKGSGDMSKTGSRAIAVTVIGISYSITVMQNSGTGSSASISTYQPKTSATNITMTRGTRTNYRFDKWTISGANGKATVSTDTITIPAYTTSVQPYGNLTITANWLPATTNTHTDILTSAAGITIETVAPITITLDKRSGTGGTNSIISVKGFYLDPTSITLPTRAGHTFNGYYTATSGGTQRINNSGTYVALTNSTYTSNVTLYAQWTANIYTITLNKNNGTGGSNSFQVTYNTTNILGISLTAPTRTGYIFNGYYTATSGGTQRIDNTMSILFSNTTYTANATLYAQWTAINSTVTFNANGGSTPSPTSKVVTYDSTYGALATTSKTNYEFIGWFTAATNGTKILTSTTVTITSAQTLYAHWKPTTIGGLLTSLSTTGTTVTPTFEAASYTITTNKGTGVSTLSVSPTSYIEKATSQTITISRSASTGYNLNNATITRLTPNGGSTPTVSGTTITIPAGSYGPFIVNQTASLKTYTVTWKDWDGTILKTQTVNHGSNGTHPGTPSRTGYDFISWDTDANNITANRTITAQYTIKQYIVTWKDWDGSTIKTQTVAHGYAGTHPSDPSRQGYTFTGWSQAATNVTANRTITAQYERLRYYVKWMRDWNNTIIKDEYVYWGESAVAPSTADMQFYEGYEIDSVSADHTYITSDLTIYVTQKLKTYKLTIGSLTGVNTITVRLNSSGGTILSNNANITHGDKLYITATAASGYNAPTVSGSPVTVSGNVTASSYVTRGPVRSFKLTKNTAPTGVSAFTVTRTSSPLQGASTGTLNTNATIYYNDKLTLSATASTGYNNPSVSPSSSVTVTGNVTASVTAGTKKQYEVKWVETYTGQNQIIYSTMVYHGDPVTTGPPDYPDPGTGYEAYEDSAPATITGPTTILVHKRLKTYKLTIGSKTGVGTITVRLNSSGGTILSNNANITHGDKLYITATAATGYNAPTVSGSPVTVTGNVTASNYVTAGSQQITTVTLTATVIDVRIDAGPPGNGRLTGIIKHNGPSNVHIPITITYYEVFGDLGYYSDFSGYTRTITSSGAEVMGVLTYQGDSVYAYAIGWSSGSVIVGGVKYVINPGGASG